MKAWIELIAQFVQWLIKRDAVRTIFYVVLTLLFYLAILQLSKIADNMNKEKIVEVEKRIETENKVVEHYIEYRDGKKQERMTPTHISFSSSDSSWVAPGQSVGVQMMAVSMDTLAVSSPMPSRRGRYDNE